MHQFQRKVLLVFDIGIDWKVLSFYDTEPVAIVMKVKVE